LTALKPSTLASAPSGPLPTEIQSAGPLGMGHLVTVVMALVTSAGLVAVLWFAIASLCWVVLRVLTLMSAARRRQAAGF
jgi:hypothetical protein